MSTAAPVIEIVTTLLVAALLVGWFARSASDPKEVAAWAGGHDLELTERNRAMVTYYVRLAITLRVIGGVGGLVLGHLFDVSMGLHTSSGTGFWIWIVLGWLLGAGWAEYRLTRPGSSVPAASLTPRQVRDYLPAGLSAGPVVAGALTIALCVGGLLAPTPVNPEARPLPRLAFAGAAAGATLIAVLVTRAMRAVVARRQPTSPADVVAADDAIRSSALHHLAGGGTAALLLIAGQLSASILLPYHSSARGWVPTLFFLSAFVAWRWSAYRRWHVRRGPAAVAVDR